MQRICTSYISCEETKKLLFTKEHYPILECTQCGHRFTEISDKENHLSKVYGDEYFFGGKDGYPNYLNKKDLLYEQGLTYARLISKYTTPGKVLDIGCAAGYILKGFEQSGWDCHGIEPNDTMASYGREKLRLNIKTGSIETFESSKKFDLVNLIQVIGHVYDVDKTLENVTRILKPDGLVLIESWNRNSIAAQLLGKQWHEYSPPSVVHWYSDKTLKLLFNYYGFEIVAKGHPIKKISLEHAFSFLEGKSSNAIVKNASRLLNRFLKRYAVINPFFDVKWYVFRKVSSSTQSLIY